MGLTKYTSDDERGFTTTVTACHPSHGERNQVTEILLHARSILLSMPATGERYALERRARTLTTSAETTAADADAFRVAVRATQQRWEIELVREMIRIEHNCASEHDDAPPALVSAVGQSFRVWTLRLVGHPNSERAYGWVVCDDERSRVYVVLHAGGATSPPLAVMSALTPV